MFFLKPGKKIIISFLLLIISGWSQGTVLNFKNADIRNVIEAVSKATGKNFLVDPRVSGRVTLVSASDLDDKALYSVFLSILRIHGFIATKTDNGIIEIVPNSEIRTEAKIEKPSSNTSGDEIIMAIIPIINTKATALIPILRPMVSRNGHLVAHGDSNNILVSDTKSNIKKLKNIIAKIDSANKSKLHILPLDNANASNLVKTIKAIFKNRKNQNRVYISAEKRTNSLLILSNQAKFNEIKIIVKKLDLAQDTNGEVAVIKVNNSTAKNIVNVIKKIISKKNRGATGNMSLFKDNVQVSVDEKSNAIVVVGSLESVKTVRGIVKKLDIKRKQVLVEVIIVEVTARKFTQFGLQWGKPLIMSAAEFAKNAVEGGTIKEYIGNDNNGNAQYQDRLTVGYEDAFNFSILTDMLGVKADVNANLLSAPSILTIENEKATIEVGQEVPFLTSNTTDGKTGISKQSISRKTVGITLEITPQINDNGVVKLEINQEISGILPSAEQADSNAADIITSTRKIKTNVLVKNKNILVLGGLIDDNVMEEERPTVLFGRIPIFGQPFRQRRARKSKRNLMMFIRPTIITNEHTGKQISKQKYQYMRDLQMEKQQQGIKLMPDEQHPVLKQLSE